MGFVGCLEASQEGFWPLRSTSMAHPLGKTDLASFSFTLGHPKRVLLGDTSPNADPTLKALPRAQAPR